METDCFYVAFISLTTEQFAFAAVLDRKRAKSAFGRDKQFWKKYVHVGGTVMLRKITELGKMIKLRGTNLCLLQPVVSQPSALLLSCGIF